jgi:hypothetical protein
MALIAFPLIAAFAVYAAMARHAVFALERVHATAEAIDNDRFDKASKLVLDSLLPADSRDGAVATQALQDEQAAALRSFASQAGGVVAIDPGVRRLRRATAQGLRHQAEILAIPRGNAPLASEPAADRARDQARHRWRVHPVTTLPAASLHAADATLARFHQVADVTIHAHLVVARNRALDIVNADTSNVASFGPAQVESPVVRDGWAAVLTEGGMAVVSLDGAHVERIFPGSFSSVVASARPDAVWLVGDSAAQEATRTGLTGRTFPGPVFADAGTFVVSGNITRAGAKLDLRDPAGKVLRSLEPGTTLVAAAIGKVALTDANGELSFWAPTRRSVTGRSPPMTAGVFAPDASAFASVDTEGQVWLLRGDTVGPVATIDGHPNGQTMVWLGSTLFVPVAAANGRSTVATVSVDDGSVHLLRIRDDFTFVGAF